MFYIISLLKSLIFFTGSYSVNVFPSPLEKDEEEKLINQMLMGDTDARGKLIEHNLRLVAHIVKKYEGKEYDSDDLISIGTIGLVKGIDSYKPSKNTRITTYVARCIENEVLMYFRSNKKHLNNVSLNDSIGYDKDGNEINLIDVLKCESEDTLDKIDTQNKIDLLLKYLDTLSPREKDIIIKHMWGATLCPPKYKEGYIVTIVDKYSATAEYSEHLVQKVEKLFRGRKK